MNIELKQSCTACGRSLKIRLEEVPEADFYINCPKCKADQLVRASDVAALSGSTVPSTPKMEPRATPLTPAPSRPDEQDSLGFGAQDLTDSSQKKRGKTGAGVPVNPTPAFVDRDGPSLSNAKILPRNAPRTTPRAGADARAPIVAIVGGGLAGVLLLAIVVWVIWPGKKADPGPATDIERDIATITARYSETGPGGTAPDLFREGLELFRGDSYADHREAGDRFRRALAAAPHHPEPLAALALNSVFLPRSDRDGIGVAQASVWADHVQKVLPGSLLGSAARATLLSSMGRAPDAKQLAEQQLSMHADSAHAWFVLGHVQRGADPKAASESLRKAVELDPGYRIAQTELAEAELSAGRMRGAAEASAARDKMGSPSSWSERVAAGIASRLGDPVTAINRLKIAVELEPKDVDARLDLGWHLVAAGKPADAATHAKRVIEVDRPAEDATEGQLADAKLLLAETMRRTGDAKGAIALAKTIARAHPQKGASHYLLGLAELEGADAEAAAETLRVASQSEPRAIVFVALGMAFAKGGHPEDAVGAFQTALEKDRGEMLAHLGLASIYADADLPGRALDEWDKMLAEGDALAPLVRLVDPRFPRPKTDLATQLKRLQRIETTDPNRDNRYRFYEAALHCESGRAGEGVDRVAGIRVFEPSHGAYIAGCAIAAGRAKEALRLTASPKDANQEAVRGWALQAGKMAGAESQFRKAIMSDPSEPFARLGLAQLLVSRGKRAEALELLGGAEARLGPVPALLKARVEAGGP